MLPHEGGARRSTVSRDKHPREAVGTQLTSAASPGFNVRPKRKGVRWGPRKPEKSIFQFRRIVSLIVVGQHTGDIIELLGVRTPSGTLTDLEGFPHTLGVFHLMTLK